MNRYQRLKHHRPNGFTLVELMIGMVVLMIGVMATMAMQTSALAGYTATRDGTAAADLGRSVEQIIKTEAGRWTGVDLDVSTVAFTNFDTDLHGANALLQSSSLIGTIQAKPWIWHRLSAKPTDNNLSVHGSRRFCSYIHGGPRIPNSAIGGEADEVVMLIVQIAVVYPAARGIFDANNCPDAASLELNASNTDDLELKGLRASFFATQVYPRGL